MLSKGWYANSVINEANPPEIDETINLDKKIYKL